MGISNTDFERVRSGIHFKKLFIRLRNPANTLNAFVSGLICNSLSKGQSGSGL